MSGFDQLRSAAPAGAGLLLSSQGGASRRQWWLGHLWAALFACLGFLGGVGVLISFALQFGLDPGETGGKMLVLAAGLSCLLLFAGASNALCRRRLNERGEAHDLVDAVMGLAALWLALALYHGARALLIGHWALPGLPQWLLAVVAASCCASLAALVLECGVFEHMSLTELWRGRREPDGIWRRGWDRGRPARS
ncbi:hypothetical protein SAMN05444161_7587 [Rhizobiales bacterium GAS191]|nr:hypothetical protein SAMN05444161_7587 [Rhizobiales bacterium GAS191]